MWFVTEVSRVWFAFFEKDLQIQFANVSGRIVQSDFPILPYKDSETVISVRPCTTKTLL